MNRFSRFLEKWVLPWQAQSVNESSMYSRFLTLFTDGRELPGPRDFVQLTEEGFRRNAIIYACISVLSRSTAEPDIKVVTVQDDGTLATDRDDPLATLIDKPNSYQDKYEFFEKLVMHLYIAGNAFIYKVRGAMDAPIALELIRPDIVGIVPGQTRDEGFIKAYTVRVGGNFISLDPADVIHLKLPDALDDYWGLSPLYVLAKYGDVDVQATDFLRAFFTNRGIPSGLLTFDKPVAKTERERIRDLWKEQFQGITGWHNVSVLDANVTYQQLSTGVANLVLSSITDQTETRMCSVFGVPPVVVSALSGITHEKLHGLETAQKVMWQNTLTPLYSRISRKLTAELAKTEFGKNRQIIFDLSKVGALQENRSELRKIGIQGWNLGLLTRHQALTLLGISSKDAAEDTGSNMIRVTPGVLFQTLDGTPQTPVEDITPVVTE